MKTLAKKIGLKAWIAILAVVLVPAVAFAIEALTFQSGTTGSGYNTISDTKVSAAIGSNNTFGGAKYSLAVGEYNTITETPSGNTGYGNLAVGMSNTLDSDRSAAVGQSNFVDDDWSVAFGYNNDVTKRYSGAIGDSNQVTMEYSVALGRSLIVNQTSAVIVGKYNDTTEYDAPVAFAVGNGTSGTAPGNAFIVYHDGRVILKPQGDISMGSYGN